MSDQISLAQSILRRGIQILFFLALQALILFAISGDLTWIWAWIYLGVGMASTIVNAAFMFSRSPETIAERGHPERGEKWDKRLSAFWGITEFILLLLVSALDARLRWSVELAVWLHILGALLYSVGLGLFGWAMISNSYFSTTVRIQSERGHQVCRTGPYRYVRHPGYTGTIFQSIGIPVLLGSLYGLIPGLLAVTLIVLRTGLEDTTLKTKLEGYVEYSHATRFRLVPGIW